VHHPEDRPDGKLVGSIINTPPFAKKVRDAQGEHGDGVHTINNIRLIEMKIERQNNRIDDPLQKVGGIAADRATQPVDKHEINGKNPVHLKRRPEAIIMPDISGPAFSGRNHGTNELDIESLLLEHLAHLNDQKGTRPPAGKFIVGNKKKLHLIALL
jgi:hypothetical protein